MADFGTSAAGNLPQDAARVIAVVLAGGASTRFGSDKLAELVGGQTLLDLTLSAIPVEAEVVLVGPVRPVARSAMFVREQPAGTGPAAAVVTGLRHALSRSAEAILVLPGDAPAAGRGAAVLLDALGDSAVESVVATDADGRWQPLQLALRPAAAQQLVDLAQPNGAAGQSARRLLTHLDPPPQPVTLEPAAVFDIDTPDALRAWRRRTDIDPVSG